MPRGKALPNQDAMQRVMREYDKAREEYDAPCAGRPDIFIDYASPTDPGIPEAQMLCATVCKIGETCREYAMIVKPDHGVWDGDVWVNGKPKYRLNLDELEK